MRRDKEYGFALQDAVIAIVIIMVFTGVILTISYNIYLQSNFIKRNTAATNYIVELFEYAKTISFENINYNNLSSHFNGVQGISVNNDTSIAISRGYTMSILIEDFYEDDNEEKELYSKKIIAKVRYKLGTREKKVEMSTFVNKY